MAVKIVLSKPIKAQIQFGRSRPRHTQWIEIGDHVAAYAIRADELVDAILQLCDITSSVVYCKFSRRNGRAVKQAPRTE